MTENEIRCAVTLEEDRDGRMLRGVILQEGRAAMGGRAKVFAPQSVRWPDNGLAVRLEHRGRVVARAIPVRAPNGEIRIATPATPEIVAAVQGGKRAMSVEFRATEDLRTPAGVREIRAAIVDAAALTCNPEYEQARAEVRQRDEVPVWL